MSSQFERLGRNAENEPAEPVERLANWMPRPAAGWGGQWRGAPAHIRWLVILGLGSFLWLVATMALLALDPRQVLGAPTWMKPVKFAASISLASLTLAWLLPAMALSEKAARRVAAILVGCLALELIIISLQAARGVPSHFNNATPIDGLLFTVMGLAIVVTTLVLAYLAARSFRHRFADGAFGWGIRLGLVAMLLGSAVGGVMPRPTTQQMENLRAGRAVPLVGGHAVGVADGGPGLPVSGWSTAGGDLRVPHFVGLHGLQVIPLFAWWLGRRRDRASRSNRGAQPASARRLVIAFGCGYIGLTTVTLVQALKGQPVLRPDAATLTLATAVVAVAVLLVVLPPSLRRLTARAVRSVAP